MKKSPGCTTGLIAFLMFGTPAIAQAQHAAMLAVAPDYKNFGKDDRWGLLRCFDSGFWKFAFKKCTGYPPSSLPWTNDLEPRSAAELLTWIDSRQWATSSGAVERQPVDATIPRTEWPKLSVQSIEKPRDFNLSLVPARGSLLGKITVESGNVADLRYGVSGLGSSYEKEFYIVASGFVARDEREPVDLKTLGPSRMISGWYILGIKKEGTSRRVVRVGNTGTIRWCGHPHGDAKKKGTSSAFQKCAAQPAYGAIVGDRTLRERLISFAPAVGEGLRGASLMSPQWVAVVGGGYANSLKSRSGGAEASAADKMHLALLNEFLLHYDPFTDPVWITCGVGCCILET